MSWCEANRVDYVFGLAKNERLETQISRRAGRRRDEAVPHWQAGPRLQGLQLSHAESWSRERRVVGKAEYLRQGQSALRRHLAASRCVAGAGALRRQSTARAATWRTASRSGSSTCSPTAPPPRPCGPTSCGSGSPPSPMSCWSAAPHRPARHRAGQRHLRHPAPEAAEDRCASAHERAPHPHRHDQQPSPSTRMAPGSGAPTPRLILSTASLVRSTIAQPGKAHPRPEKPSQQRFDPGATRWYSRIEK